MANVKEMMIRKESLKYRDVCEYEGKFYDWKAGEHLLQKGMVVDEMFHPLARTSRAMYTPVFPPMSLRTITVSTLSTAAVTTRVICK